MSRPLGMPWTLRIGGPDVVPPGAEPHTLLEDDDRATYDDPAPGSTSPDSYARTTACTRSRRASFMSTCATWLLTVVSDMYNASAISALLSPRAIAWKTSISRSVNWPQPCGAGGPPPADRPAPLRANSCSSRRVIR